MAQENGQQACVGSLDAFEAVFTATLTVAMPGQVTFNLYSDDGWILAAGADANGDRPTYLSGSCSGAICSGIAPSTSSLMGYPVIGAYNQVSAPAQNTVTVNFPAAGTYPIELDYTECCGGQLALVLGTGYANPIVPQNPQAGQRQIVFVHGINGNAAAIDAAGFSGSSTNYGQLIQPLRQQYSVQAVHVFSYYQDISYALDPNADPPQCGPTTPSPDTRAVGIIPVDTASISGTQCDSESDLGLDATKLDDELYNYASFGTPLAVIGHSMGGAIIRGWLALAQREQDQTLKSVDTVITFQGAQQGSYIPNGFACSPIQSHVTTRAVLAQVMTQVAHKLHFYTNRPAFSELKPQSSWYDNINRQDVPTGLRYYNFYTNLQVNHYKLALFWPIPDGPITGATSSCRREWINRPPPCSGGARFLPGSASPTADGAGPEGYQWAITRQYAVLDTPGFDPSSQALTAYDLVKIATDPANHLNLGGYLNNTRVTVPDCAAPDHPVTVTTLIEHILADPSHVCGS